MAVSVVNQWAGTFSQPASFQTTPPALQSVVVALTPANSVGGGTGTPTAGNWLVTLVGMNEQSAAAGFTVGVKDDLRSYWRPAKVSTAAALTRTSCWYTPNAIRAAGNVYVAPSGAFDALSVLVVELSGAGPWDTLTVAPASNYAAAATSLGLSAAAPSAASFAIAAVTGDSTAAGQAFAPGGWTALHTVSATNGVDHTCDAVLTSAFLASNSGSLSVSASASSATDLSGVLAEFAVTAASPIPSAGAGQNPNWPYTILEAAFGSGFGDPEDTMTWTSLNDLAIGGAPRRFWSWSDTTGVPYALGQLQSSTGAVQLDNVDGQVSPLNPASLHYTSAAGWQPLSAFYDPLVTGQAPLAWWKLADASGSGTAADSSGNGHTGTPSSVTFGNASEAVTGNTSAAFASGSTSHVTTAYLPALTAVTVECWVNLNGLSQSGNPALIADSNTASDHKGFVLGLSGTTPQILFGNTTTAATVTASSALPASGWTHLAGTWDGTTVTLYVNGVTAGTAALSGTMPAGTATGIGLGFNPATTSAYINGLLSECAVYGAALTSQQIAAHFTAGPAGTGTPVRVRMALGTIAGITYNRWHTWTRNGLAWPEKRNKALRNYVEAALTDSWSVVSGSCPTPYRGEIEQEPSLYAWWACDDQPAGGGVLPTSLRNSAPGNTNVLNVVKSPNGITGQLLYDSNGTQNSTASASVALESFAANQGWQYGDPQSSPSSYQTSNPVTSNPGSAAWQASGQAGNTGSFGFFLSCNDNNFPPLANGVTIEGWFNYAYLGSSTADPGVGPSAVLAAQPVCPLTLWEIATGSNPVAELQLDTSGHLNLITFNGATGTSHAIYTTSDMRSQTWWHIAVTMTAGTWTVYVNGGVTAVVSGSGAGMTSAWTWIIFNGDLGTHGGSSAGTGLVHGGNASFSHLAVYSAQLPAWRLLAHYCAAATAFGVIPAPQGVQVTINDGSGPTWSPDGSTDAGTYSSSFGGGSLVTMSAVAVSVIGTSTSGPSAWANAAAFVPLAFAWVGWDGVADKFAIYTASSLGVELQGDIARGNGDAYTSGFGGSTAAHGKFHVASGSGASPPTAASTLGDTVAQRMERVLGYGGVTAPNRAIDPAANLLVQAATDVGGQQCGASLQNLVDSDNGLLFTDSNNTLCYSSRPNLANDVPIWSIGMNTAAGQVPFAGDITWDADAQRIYDAVTVQPFSPDGASLASLVPVNSAAANAAEAQFGVRPKQVTSYLQDQTKVQAAANWWLSAFGLLQRRAAVITIDAASYPGAWGIVAAAQPGDLATIYDQPLGQPATTGTYRISQIVRGLSNGANGNPVQARLTLILDAVPGAGYWS